MDNYTGSGSPNWISFRSDREKDGQPQQEQAEEMDTSPAPAAPVAEREIAPRVHHSGWKLELSSTSDDAESCGAYFTRKMETLGTERTILPTSVNPVDEEKISKSEPMVFTPEGNYADLPDDTS